MYLITFDYGQRHNIEIDYAKILSKELKVHHEVIDISSIGPLLQSSALINKSFNVPEGSYNSDNMALTVVPNRNAIMLTIAYAAAVSMNAKYAGTAIHTSDNHVLYSDCTHEFVEVFDRMERVATRGLQPYDLQLWAPFINQTKSDIAKIGIKLGIDYTRTRSRYNRNEFHCGLCATCIERKQSFKRE